MNLRSLLLDIITDKRKKEPKKLISELYLAIEEAEQTLELLNSLKEELSELEEELKITVCEMGI